jgi:hypothetical protein
MCHSASSILVEAKRIELSNLRCKRSSFPLAYAPTIISGGSFIKHHRAMFTSYRLGSTTHWFHSSRLYNRRNFTCGLLPRRNLVSDEGFEPSYLANRARVLPLNESDKFCGSRPLVALHFAFAVKHSLPKLVDDEGLGPSKVAWTACFTDRSNCRYTNHPRKCLEIRLCRPYLPCHLCRHGRLFRPYRL